MDELVEFLQARIAEDQAEIAKHSGDDDQTDGLRATQETGYPCYDILLIGKKRAVREVESKLRTVEWYAENPSEHWSVFPLRDIAAVYSDHPDYRKEWRP